MNLKVLLNYENGRNTFWNFEDCCVFFNPPKSPFLKNKQTNSKEKLLKAEQEFCDGTMRKENNMRENKEINLEQN